MTRGRWTLVLVVAVSAAAVVGFWWVRGSTDETCSALSSPVAELDGFDWENGITSQGPQWISVLTAGVTEADEPSRQQIARAVEADDQGYVRFRAALPTDLGDEADRLRDVAVDPAAIDEARTSEAVGDDVIALVEHARERCGLV